MISAGILLIDNYDSFTYNVHQYLSELGADCLVRRNDRITLDEIAKIRPAGIVISPGPGTPRSAGITLSLIRRFAGQVPILGVCLGHQAIGEAFGGQVVRGGSPVHGKVSAIRHEGRGVFHGLPTPLRAARYHSLVIERASLPSCLEITAETPDGVIMGVRHRELAVEGVQFHPESIATEHGREMLANFLREAGSC